MAVLGGWSQCSIDKRAWAGTARQKRLGTAQAARWPRGLDGKKGREDGAWNKEELQQLSEQRHGLAQNGALGLTHV